MLNLLKKTWFRPISKIVASAITLLIVTLSGGCGSTKMVHSWKAPDFKGPEFRKVLIIGIASRPEVRQTYEDAFVRRLEDMVAHGVASYTLLPDVATVDEAAVAQAAKKTGADAVLVTHLVKIAKVTTVSEAPPEIGVQDYIESAWSGTYTPAEASVVDVVTLESRLFDVATTKLVWSGTTETFDAMNLDQAIEDVSRTITKQLAKQKMF